jgi:HSP20 family protein
MTLIKRNNGVHNSLPAFLDDFFAKDVFDFAPSKSFSTLAKSMPAVNILETEKEYKIEVAAPGLKKEDIKVELENDLLTISSEVKQEKEEKDKEGRYTRREFSFSSFKRSFTVDEDTVDTEKIEAKYEDGILNIHVPKKTAAQEEKKAKTISIA